MKRTPMELAAVASAAVPGLSPAAVTSDPDDNADFESALVIDTEKRRWRVRSPKHVEASTRLETERAVLRIFSAGVRADLPFLLPAVAGTVRMGELTTFVYSHLPGRAQEVEKLTKNPAALAKEIGTALAAIHSLPGELVTEADLPSYTANEFRQRKLNELDQAATTGKIPAALLRRWEHALEDVALWRFSPCVVHGDFHEDNLLIDGGRLSAVTGFTDVRFADPADDFAWLTAIDNPQFVDAVVESYSTARADEQDKHMMRRAALSAEFALAQWLVRGVAASDQSMVAEAEQMLRTLEADIAAHGGQSISVEPPVTAPKVSAAVTVSSAVSAEPIPAQTEAGAETSSHGSGAEDAGGQSTVPNEDTHDDDAPGPAIGAPDAGQTAGHPAQTPSDDASPKQETSGQETAKKVPTKENSPEKDSAERDSTSGETGEDPHPETTRLSVVEPEAKGTAS